MFTSITNRGRRVLIVGTAIMVFAVAFSFATPARAQTVADLQAQIQLLLAQIAALQGGSISSASSCVTFTQNLTIGSTGFEVLELQKFLNSRGFTVASVGVGFPGKETTYFGSLTAAAAARFQAANGILPAVGYFGPITRSAVNSMCVPAPVTPGPGPTPTPSPTPSPTSGPLKGGAGSITDADFISGVSNEKVGEGATDVEVMGLKLEADDGSDIELSAVTLNFSQGTADRRFDRYAKEVTIWLDGKEYASIDANAFTSNRNYNRTVSLRSGAVIRAGRTGDLIVAVSGLRNIDSNDVGETWTIAIDNVRFRDAQDASISDSSTGDIGNTRSFSFDTYASAKNVQLRASGSDATPKGVVNIDDHQDTDDVELLRFTLEARGGDIRLRDFPITFATSSGNTANTLAKIAHTVYLEIDGKEWSENASSAVAGVAGATVTFDDVDVTIDKGDKVTVIVRADINDTQAGSFVDGDILTASFTADNRAVLEAEDESGEDLASGDRIGTGIGKALAFYDIGIKVKFVSASETVVTGAAGQADDDTVTLKLVFEVQAFDGTVYLANHATSTTAADGTVTSIDVDDGGIVYRYSIDGVATTELLTHVVTKTNLVGTVSSDSNEYTLDDGEKVRITLSVSRVNAQTHTDSDGFHEMQLVAIGWSTTADDATMNVYDFDLVDFKTDPIFAN